jgi:hypothetical protein
MILNKEQVAHGASDSRVIAPDLAAFLESGLSIHIATCSGGLEPRGSRVAAVKVDADGTHLTAFVPKIASRPILADLEANPHVAVGFGRPTDDRACQVKGEFVQSRAGRPAERELVVRQWNGLMSELAQIGFSVRIADGWTTWPVVAVRLRVTALFSQTPGPGAGAPMP